MESPFHIAQTADLQVVKDYFNAENASLPNNAGFAPIHSAAMRDDDDPLILHYLVTSCGVDVNQKCRYTPLQCAVMQRKSNCVRMLLQLGADMEDRFVGTGRNDTPFQRAIRDGSHECARIFIDYGAPLAQVKEVGPVKWAFDHIAARKQCFKAALLLLGLRRYRQSSVLNSSPLDIIKMISYHVWSTRHCDYAWYIAAGVKPHTRTRQMPRPDQDGMVLE
jgi:ankyrin repeat protein